MALEWVHCNVCYAQPHPSGKSYFLSSCGHIICNGCKDGARPLGSCPECSKQGGVTWVKLTSKLPPEVVSYFTNPKELVAKLKRTVDFQSMHQDKLLGGLHHDYLVARCVELAEGVDSLNMYCQELDALIQQLMGTQQVAMGTDAVAMATSGSPGSSPMSISPHPNQLTPGSQTRHLLTPQTPGSTPQSRGSTPCPQSMEQTSSCDPEERPSPHSGAHPHLPSLRPSPNAAPPPHLGRLPSPHQFDRSQSSLHPSRATGQPSAHSEYLSQSQFLQPHSLHAHRQPSPHLRHHFQAAWQPSPLYMQMGPSPHTLHSSQTAPSPFSAQPTRQPSPHDVYTGRQPSPHNMQPARQPSPHNVYTSRQPSPHSMQAGRQPSPHGMQPARRPSPHAMQAGRRPSPHSMQPVRQPSPHDTRAYRQPSPHDTRTYRQPSPHDTRTYRQPSPHDTQAYRQPSPHDMQTSRQPSPHSMQTSRKPSPHDVTAPKPSPYTRLASLLQARHNFQDSPSATAQPTSTPTTHISGSQAAAVPYPITLASPRGHHTYRTPLSGTHAESMGPP